LNNLTPGQGHIQALVMCPTRELALQVSQALSEYGQFCDVRVLAVYGGQPYGPQITRLKRGWTWWSALPAACWICSNASAST